MVRAACESAAWLEVEADTPAEATAASVPAAVTTIDLSHQQLTVSSLQLLPSTLTCVDLSRCGLESVAPLSRLPRLELLNVSYNRLTSLEDVQHSGHLKVLYARSNRITHLDGAAQLALLQSLDLECNSLSSLESLTPLWNLRSLTELRLRGNVLPIAAYRRTCAAKLPLLRSLDGSDMEGPPDGGGGNAAVTQGADEIRPLQLLDESAIAEAASAAASDVSPGSTAGPQPSFAPFCRPAAFPVSSTSHGGTSSSIGGGQTRQLTQARVDAARDGAAHGTMRCSTAASTSARAGHEADEVRKAAEREAAEEKARAASVAAALEATETMTERVQQLEVELGAAEANRQREVNECARSAAVQVQQLSRAIVKADKMLAEVTLENERLSAELMAAEARHQEHTTSLQRSIAETEANAARALEASRASDAALRAEVEEVRAQGALEAAREREATEVAVQRAEKAEMEAITAVAAAGGKPVTEADTPTSPPAIRGVDPSPHRPSTGEPSSTGDDSLNSGMTHRPGDARDGRKVRVANEARARLETELRRKVAGAERMRVQLEAKTSAEQLMRRQLGEMASWLRSLPPRVAAALAKPSDAAGGHRDPVEGAIRQAVSGAISQQVEAQLATLEQQRTDRDAQNAAVVAEAARSAQSALRAAEEEMDAQKQLMGSMASLQAECDSWEGRYNQISDELAETRQNHARDLQAASAARLAAEERMATAHGATSAELDRAQARIEALSLERAAAQEQAFGSKERVGALERTIHAKEMEVADARREAAQQATVLGKQQVQLESLLADVQREKDAVRSSAADAETTRAKLRDAEAARTSADASHKAQTGELRAKLEQVMAESESSERRLLAQLKERSAALSLSLEDLATARNQTAGKEAEASKERQLASQLSTDLSKARAELSDMNKRLELVEVKAGEQQSATNAARSLTASKEAEVAALRQTSSQVSEELSKARAEGVEARRKIARLEATISEQESAVAAGIEAKRQVEEYKRSLEQTVGASLEAKRSSEQAAQDLASSVADLRARAAKDGADAETTAATERHVWEERLRAADASKTEAMADAEELRMQVVEMQSRLLQVAGTPTKRQAREADMQAQQVVVEDSRRDGFEEGRRKGKEEGCAAGRKEGFDEGWHAGHEAGREERLVQPDPVGIPLDSGVLSSPGGHGPSDAAVGAFTARCLAAPTRTSALAFAAAAAASRAGAVDTVTEQTRASPAMHTPVRPSASHLAARSATQSPAVRSNVEAGGAQREAAALSREAEVSSLAGRLAASDEASRVAHQMLVAAETAVRSADREAAVLCAVLIADLAAADRRIAKLERQRDTARRELERSVSNSACAQPLSHEAKVAAVQLSSIPPPSASQPAQAAVGSHLLPPHRVSELYATAAQDGGAASVAMRLVEYETALDQQRRRTAQALSACQAFEHRAKQSESKLQLLQNQLSVVSGQRGNLAVSLDASLRQLGSAHKELHDHRMRHHGRPQSFDSQPGSWGLLQDLHQLHLKLHDGRSPALGGPPSTVP